MPERKSREFRGTRNLKRLAGLAQTKQDEEVRRTLELGLEAAPSINDRTISLFSRGHQPAFAGINTFMKAPYCEDMRKVQEYEAAFVGVPFDTGTTYRPGTRFGPQAVRRVSALYDGYSVNQGVDLNERLKLCDAGDVFVIPGNIEKSFDQVTKAISHVYTSGVFPSSAAAITASASPMCAESPRTSTATSASSTSTGISTSRKRTWMSGCTPPRGTGRRTSPPPHPPRPQPHARHWAAQLPAAQPGSDGHRRLVRLAPGHQGRAAPRHQRHDHDRHRGARPRQGGRDGARSGMEGLQGGLPVVRHQLHRPGFAPGTGTPEPGGLLPREALEMVRRIAREGLCGMEVVEVSPPYDVNDNTAQLACRVMLDVLGTLVAEGKLGALRRR